ncbi:hypothetical protein VTN31DRAFT_1649 [Thermomyces dupontii]|uniref:uncharacterized protein n=1 Tax=Talaromyces thermophilus TaxID=28565 RepID=UPI00374343D2
MFVRRIATPSRGIIRAFLRPTHISYCYSQRTVATPFSTHSSRAFAAANAAMAEQTTGSSSPVTPESIRAKLTSQLEATHVEVEDLSGGCGQAFQAIIVSPQFDKKNALARHRLVNSVLKEEIAAIHAWTPKCYTPEQWQKMQEERS